MNKKDYQGAIADLDKAIGQLNPKYFESLQQYFEALAKNELKQHKEAIADFDKAQA